MALRRVSTQLNFFHGVAGKYDLDCPADLPLGFDRYDRVAFPNEGRRDAYVAAGIVPADRAGWSAIPKVDVLARDRGDAGRAGGGARPRRGAADGDLRADVLARVRAERRRRGDHRDAARRPAATSSPSCTIARSTPIPRYTGGVNWRERLGRFTPARISCSAAGGDSTPYVLASDVMVTDHSSIGFEFCVLDRPLVVFDAPGLVEAARINPEKVALLRSAATVVGDAAAARARRCAKRSLLPHARGSAARAPRGEQVFYQPGSATARALQLVYELIELPAAAVATAAGARAA